MVVHTYNPDTPRGQEMGVGRSEGQVCPWLHHELEMRVIMYQKMIWGYYKTSWYKTRPLIIGSPASLAPTRECQHHVLPHENL